MSFKINRLPTNVDAGSGARRDSWAPQAPATMRPLIRFGTFQLDTQAGQLLKNGRVVRLKPQPQRLLQLLLSRPGELITRDEIRDLLWGTDTFVDFEQGMNTAIRQIREALGDDAETPIFVETVPKRGYRFIAPVDTKGAPPTIPLPRGTDLNLHKALWLNIAELRLAEVRRRKRRRKIYIGLIVAAAVLVAVAAIVLILKWT
jgi:DNA-binding winged helix-turn-helix (wHTH) protein